MTDELVSRNATVESVSIGVDLLSADQLPAIALTVCLPEVGVLLHEHVVVTLSPTILDAIEEARAKLPELMVEAT